MISKLFIYSTLLLLIPSINALGVSFHGTLPSSVIHNLESLADLGPVENMNILRQSMRDIADFAENLMGPAVEAAERRNGISEVKKASGATSHELKLRPRFDVQDTKDGFMLFGTLPGLRKEELSLEIVENAEGRVLEITGGSQNTTSRSPSPARGDTSTPETSLKLRAGYAKFERRIRLPQHVDPSTLQAKYEDGLLVVTMRTLAKKDSSQRQKIVIH